MCCTNNHYFKLLEMCKQDSSVLSIMPSINILDQLIKKDTSSGQYGSSY